MRTIIITAAALATAMIGLAPLPASANKDGYYRHCLSADAHQHNEGRYIACIIRGSLQCRSDCNRDFPDSSDYRACSIACTDRSGVLMDQQLWKQ